MKTETQRVVAEILRVGRRAPDPGRDLRLRVKPTVQMGPGMMLLLPQGHMLMSNKEEAKDLAEGINAELGIKAQWLVGDKYMGMVCTEIQGRIGHRLVEDVCADWYARTGCKWKGYDGKIYTIIMAITEDEPSRRQDTLWRGEENIYPDMPSTLARRLGVKDEAGLRRLEQYVREEGRKRRGIEGYENKEEGLWSTLQHRGRPTAYLDFSISKWIALWFACGGKADEIGRVWKLTEEKRWKYTILDATKNDDRIAKERAEKQGGRLVLGKAGYVEHEDLKEVVHIPGDLKVEVRRFLGTELGINKEVLFADIDGWPEGNEEMMPFEVVIRRWMTYCQEGEAKRTEKEARNLLKYRGLGPSAEATIRYCLGVALGKMGKVEDGLEEMERARSYWEKTGRRHNKAIRQNIRVLRVARARKDASVARRKMNTQVVQTLWEEGPFFTRIGLIGNGGEVAWKGGGKLQKITKHEANISFQMLEEGGNKEKSGE